MTKSRIVKLFLLTLIMTVGLQAGESVRLVIGRPGETKSLSERKNGWYSTILDSYLQFRLMGFKDIEAVPSDSLGRFFGARGKYGLTQSRGQLNRAAKEFGASHVVKMDYTVNTREKSVILKLKVYPADQPIPVYEFSSRFPVISTQHYIDSILVDIAVSLDAALSGNEKATLRSNILMKDYGLMHKIGSAALAISETKRHEKVMAELKSLGHYAKTSPNFWLVQYINGDMNARVGLYGVAGKSYSTIVKNKQFRWLPMYVETVKSYRLAGALREATATLKDATKAGLSGVRLTFEDASVKAALGESAAAAAGFKKVLAIEPQNGDALLYLAQYQNETKSYAQVFAYTKKLISTKQLLAWAYVENGRAYQGQKKITKALDAFKTAEKQIGECPIANRYMGDIYVGRKAYDSAAMQYMVALKGINDDETLLLEASDAYQKSNNIKGARIVLENYSSLFPQSLLVERELGLVYFAVKDTVKSRSALERCTGMEPPSKEVFLTLAEIYKGSKQWVKVIGNLERSLLLVKNKDDLYFDIATSYKYLKKPDVALKNFREVVTLSPKYKQANVEIATILFAKKEYKEAISYYSNERTYHGNTVKIQEKIVFLNYALTFYKTARKECDILVKLNSKNLLGHTSLARISMHEKKYGEAYASLTKAQSLGRIDAAVYLELAKGFALGKQLESAIYTYKAYIKRNPKDYKAMMALALVYYQSGEDKNAVAIYLRAYDITPSKNEEALARAGHIIYENDDHDRAEELYGKFLASGSKTDSVLINHADMS